MTWEDYDPQGKMLLIRDRKDPRQKKGNDQCIPLLDVSGYDAVALIEEQRSVRANSDTRIFAYNHKSISAAFTRACHELRIDDLHFHDLRHEATSRLFEFEFKIQQVAPVTGHKDWKMLRRYTHLRPESLHDVVARRRPGPTDAGRQHLRDATCVLDRPDRLVTHGVRCVVDPHVTRLAPT